MKLLIITQKVDENDQLLGFFIGWLNEFSKHFEAVSILCLEKRAYSLPSNVKVFSLGKDRGEGKVVQLFNFYKHIMTLDYDSVFVHMNPIWMVLGGLIWRMKGKKSSLWYAHGRVSSKLRLANVFTDIAFTSTDEGYRIETSKKRIVGQGINTTIFNSNPADKKERRNIVSIGRISPSKDYETLIRAILVIKETRIDLFNTIKVRIVGAPATSPDEEYLVRLKSMVKDNGLESKISFTGAAANNALSAILGASGLFVNMSHTGSLDKAILEAMSCGVPVLTCNEALRDVLGDLSPSLMYEKNDHAGLAERIKYIFGLSEQEVEVVGNKLREIVVGEHDLVGLVSRVSKIIKNQNDVGDYYDRKIKIDFGGDYERHRWFKSEIARAGNNMTLEEVQKFSKTVKFNNYLEIGPGPGTWTRLFVDKNPAAKFDLVDISSEMLELARKNLIGRGDIGFVNTDFIKFEPAKKYDLFFSSRALEYISDKDIAVGKISDLIVSGGRGMIITKFPQYWRYRLANREIPEFHIKQIHPDRLAKLLKSRGLSIESIRPVTMGFPFFKSPRMNRLIKRLIGRGSLDGINSLFVESYSIIFSKP